MDRLLPLVQNETIKIWKKKRFYVVIAVLVILIPVFTYAQMKISQNNAKNFKDWRNQVMNQINDYQSMLASDRIPEEWKRQRRIAVQQLQYYIDHDVNPNTPNAVTFTRGFMSGAVTLFYPLLVLAIASDLVSGERSTGTIKMLLTRPVKRWKILLSKMIALTMYVSLIVVASAVLTYLISGAFFGYGGWTMPTFVGFTTSGSEMDTTMVHAIPQWQNMLMQSGLIWFSSMVVALLALMVSVLVRGTAASIVTMMAAIIAGTILANMSSAWESAKYVFAVNLDLTVYLNGTPPPIEGMTLPFSLAVLAIWALVGVIVSFSVFTKQDILN
ncbi:ABC-2 type transport system permease protein [Paenibacillus phyllosphaerae]|uniref:ABC-2 type transport system permease protein n=1 Tax=Paenibacillus phyllosphaerae TaxID=274593 RepID=A0A7W5FMW1_9BACL|nr:ABC transporter permease [Paenibacillus phyllosphaerae]MBB3110429.1 ABC-2 type transport system permease protein [Paenibacillus phyllosphaerae]